MQKSKAKRLYSAVLVTTICALPFSLSQAHGLIGKRFFPGTIVVDDPFVADEMSFVLGYRKLPAEADDNDASEDNSGIHTTSLSIAYSKRITPDFGISLGTAYKRLRSGDDATQRGFDNLGLGLKYQLLKSDAHEGILSIGVDADLGGTGSSRVGAESFSTISPAVFYGKGFGDLPERLQYLRPLAVTGILGTSFPTRRSEPDQLNWGFTIQYSLQYLQSFVKDIGMSAPWNRMIPLIEIPVSTCLNRNCAGQTTGTVNPGIIWFGKFVQLGVEAVIPLNKRSGQDVGVLIQLHLFIDDMFPKSFGKPLLQSR